MQNNGGSGMTIWHGTEAELDALMVSIHKDTECEDCREDASYCCGEATDDLSCAGHNIVGDQRKLDRLLFMRRQMLSKDRDAWEASQAQWWLPMATPIVG